MHESLGLKENVEDVKELVLGVSHKELYVPERVPFLIEFDFFLQVMASRIIFHELCSIVFKSIDN